MSQYATQRSVPHVVSSQEPEDRPERMSRGAFLRMAGAGVVGTLFGPGPRGDGSAGVAPSRRFANLYRELQPVLERLQRNTVEYFIQHRRHGLVLDQFPVANWPYSSMAATGFGLASYVIGVERGDIARHRAVELVDETLRTIETQPALRHRGWFTHFVDISDPVRPLAIRESGRLEKPTAEYSSVDSALFFLAALPVGSYFGEERNIAARIEKLFQEVDFPFMLNREGPGDGRLFSHGFYLDADGRERFIPTRWDTCSEGILVSMLSLADPHPSVSPVVWEAWNRDYAQLPLFVRYYPHCFMDLRDRVDRSGLNLWGLAEQEVARQLQYCDENGFPSGLFGVTACAFVYKGPSRTDQYGYFVPGFRGPNEPRVVGPHAVLSCVPFAPAAAYDSLRQLSRRGWLESEFGPINSVNLDDQLVHRGVTAIDVGSALLMLDAGGGRVMHKLAAQNARMRAALKNCGFVKVSSSLGQR